MNPFAELDKLFPTDKTIEKTKKEGPFFIMQWKNTKPETYLISNYSGTITSQSQTIFTKIGITKSYEYINYKFRLAGKSNSTEDLLISKISK